MSEDRFLRVWIALWLLAAGSALILLPLAARGESIFAPARLEADEYQLRAWYSYATNNAWTAVIEVDVSTDMQTWTRIDDCLVGDGQPPCFQGIVPEDDYTLSVFVDLPPATPHTFLRLREVFAP